MYKTENIKPILIFPAGMPRSLDYLSTCLRERRPVIGSSSLDYDVSRGKYPAWCHLPFVNDPAFNDALKAAIKEFGIGGIYTPNPVVWGYLNRVLQTIDPEVFLINDSPVTNELSGYRAATAYARQAFNAPLEIGSPIRPRQSISELEIATLFRHGNIIPGMCDGEKISALCEIFRYAVEGDVVEIGSAWGKSAFILARLAQCYGIGNTLCVDPWSVEFLKQNDNGGLVDQTIDQYDTNETLRVFEMNLLPYNKGDINYLRMASVAAAGHYTAHRNATTESFGSTDYAMRIAVLHIDGNHSHDAAKSDVEAWAPHVVAGGWIIVDDYVWPYGDGPQRVGNALIAEHQTQIAVSFVIGSALFIQLSTQLQMVKQ
ncbi:MAG: class I SAM-dependent methyltransferase [Pseudomonadota bacterium]